MSGDTPLERIGPYVYRHHAPVPLAHEARTRVAIVGGGPVGLATALGLARQGIGSIVVEADDSVCMGSRAACISRRSLEICGRLDALPEMLQRGLPWSGGRSFWQETEVFRFSMPEYPGQRLPPMINLQQYYIEDALHAAAARANARQPGCIGFLWATTVDAIEPQAQGVALSLANAHGRATLQADWVIACDGGQSFVRSALGLALEGTAYTGRYVIVDIELPSSHPTERRAWFDPPWHRGATVLMHRQPDDLWRIDWQLRHGDSTEEAMKPENVRAFVQRHLDAIGEGHLPWTPAWSSVYRAGAMTLASYRHGRVLFAGNAAHAMPIFGVRGLNSGLDDADNLAWKLAAVLHGSGADALLDSYSRERVQAFHVNADSARRSTEFMSPPSRGFDVLREAALSLAAVHRDIAELINPRQTAAVTYSESPLSTPDAEAWSGGPAPGEVLPEIPAGGPLGHVTEVVGPGFVLLHFGAPPAWNDAGVRIVPVLAQADPRWPQALIDHTGQLARSFDVAEGGAYLLRPDGHVAARWKRADAGSVRAAWQRALGHADTHGTAAAPTPSAGSARDRLYTLLAQGVSAAGSSRETLFLARLALLLCERLDDESAASEAIAAALTDVPEPSLSAPDATY